MSVFNGLVQNENGYFFLIDNSPYSWYTEENTEIEALYHENQNQIKKL